MLGLIWRTDPSPRATLRPEAPKLCGHWPGEPAALARAGALWKVLVLFAAPVPEAAALAGAWDPKKAPWFTDGFAPQRLHAELPHVEYFVANMMMFDEPAGLNPLPTPTEQ